MDTKTLLTESEMPTHWYNIQADLPRPAEPPLHPGTHQPAGPDDLSPIFPMGLIAQEMSQERYIEIPDEVQDIYRIWRPTPLYRAHRLEKELGTPAKIYFKYEGTSPAGSHKPNTAVAQAYYNKQEGVKRITTETGAGQWGSAMAMACSFMGIECKVYMVGVSYDQKPYRKSMMETWGAEVLSSPTDTTNSGRAILAQDPNSPGSLGIAISEAVEEAAGRDDTNYALGSVLNHVLMHQSVIGQEVRAQMEKLDAYPDTVIGCVGGGSSFGGISFPFIKDKLDGKDIRFIAVEPEACPTITRGKYTYDFGDTGQMTPLVKMHTLGHTFVPPPIHAGGLRYHGMAPLISLLVDLGLIEARAIHQNAVFRSAITLARTEGMISAPEPAHALAVAIDEALKCKETGEEKNILFLLCGHGNFDLSSYDAYLSGSLRDYSLPDEQIERNLAAVPQF